MERKQLAAETRDRTGKGVARKLRNQGMIPAVAYGRGVEQPFQVSVSRHEVVMILRSRTGKNTQFDLMVGDKAFPSIIKEYQIHPVSRVLTHCDFYVLNPELPVEVEVPVETEGRSVGEEEGARLFLARREVRVSCLPHLIPDTLLVDVRSMTAGDVMYVDELLFPEGVEPIYKARYPVVVVKKVKIVEEETVEAVGEEGEEPVDEAQEGAEDEAPAAADE